MFKTFITRKMKKKAIINVRIIDPKNNIYGVFLNRSLTDYNHRFYFIKAVYDAFTNQPY